MYACEKCGAPYGTEAEAASCEKAHLPFKVVAAKYQKGYPDHPAAILVRFENGDLHCDVLYEESGREIVTKR
jgi:hypothetical protein